GGGGGGGGGGWGGGGARLGLARRPALVDEADAVACAPEIDADGHGRGAPHAVERPGNRAGVAEIIGHERLDLLTGRRARIAELRRDLLLQLVPEHVVVPAPLEVQQRADPEQELLGLIEPGRVLVPADERWVGGRGDRPCGRDVAQRARRLLDVRLELVQRAAKLRVPRVGQLLERRQHAGAGARPIARFAEPVVQRRVAGDEARVDRRQQGFRIVALERRQLRHVTGLMADVERGVPEWVEQRAQETLLGLANRLAEQHEYVEVGVGTQVAAAVPAERDDCGPLRAATRGVVQPLQLAIDLLGIAVQRRRSAVAGKHGPADGPPRVLDLARHGPTVTPLSV